MTQKDERDRAPPSYADDWEPTPATWPQIRTWRRGKREAIIARRMQRPIEERRRLSEPVVAYLRANVTPARCPVVGLYWPIRGEIDLREFARDFLADGGTVGLPVVVQDAAPLEFWRWQQGMALKRGHWNIPVPPERDVVRPHVLIVPLVGFDAGRYRLGYGGGFYDRTLAAAVPRPHTIGIAFTDVELPTIHPQPHDIAMDVIVTDRFVRGGPL